MSGPGQWSSDNPFVDKQPAQSNDQWSSDNPFVDQGSVATAAPTQPEQPDHHIRDNVISFFKGALSGAKNVAVGTAHFVYDGFTYPFRGPTAEELQNPLYRASLQRYGLDPNKVQPVTNQAEEIQRAKDLVKGATVGLAEATYEGGKKALSPSSTPFQRGEGAVEGLAGAAGIHGLVSPLLPGRGPAGPVERIKARQEAQAAAPVEPVPEAAPTAPAAVGSSDLSKATTPEERAAIVEQMKQQGAQVEAKQADAKARLMQAVNTWRTLSLDQRKAIVPGLAETDYAKGWKELGNDARTTVKKALNLHEPSSVTKLEPSPVDQSAPSAQGQGAPEELPAQPAGPAPTTPEPSVATPSEPPQLGVVNASQSLLPDESLLGKRFVNPDRPEYSAILTKNTKPGEKPYRVSYFKKDVEGNVQTYLHNTFDTPQQAYEWVTSQAEKPGDKLQGYIEQSSTPQLKPGEEPSDVTFMDINTLRNELAKADGKLQDITLRESAGTDVTKRGLADERTFWEKYHNDLADEMARRLNPKRSTGEGSALFDQLDKMPDIGESSKTPDQVLADSKNVTDRVATAAALLGEDGKVYSGINHGNAYDKMPDGVDIVEHGWINKEGQFFSPSDGKPIQKTVDYQRADYIASGGDVKDFKPSPNTPEPNAPIAPEPEGNASKETGTTPPGAEGPIESSVNPKFQKLSDDELLALRDQYTQRVSSARPTDDVRDLQDWNDMLDAVQNEMTRRGLNPIDPMRVARVEQSIEDKLAAEKLINETQRPTDSGIIEGLINKPPELSLGNKTLAKVTFDAGSDEAKLKALGPEYVGKTWDQLTPEQQTKFAEEIAKKKFGMRGDDIDAMIDDVDAALDDKSITQKEHEAALFEIAELKRSHRAQNVGPSPSTPKSKFKLPDTVGKDLNKFSIEQLNNTLKSIGAMLQSPDVRNLPEANVLRQEMDRILDYKDQIRKQSEGGAGPSLSIKKIDVEGRPKYEQYFSGKIVTDADFKSPTNWIKRIRQAYQGLVRPNHAVEVGDRLFEASTGKNIPTPKAASRLMEMMDGWLTQAESYLRGDGPFVPDGAGGFIKTGARSLADIVTNIAHGDVERLGWLWAARRALDLKALRNKDIGIDLGYAQEMVVNSPRELHVAVDEARKYHSSLSLLAQMEGLISPEARAAFEQETSYGPIQRMYGPNEMVSKMVQTINKTGRTAEQIAASDEFKRLKGSNLLVRNMVESTIDATHRILRAAKINRIALELVEKAAAQPELFKGMVEPFSHKERLQISKDLNVRANAVKAIFKEAGMDLSSKHADLFANLLSDDALNVKEGKLLVWRNGEIEAWKVDELYANSLKSLTPQELPSWVRAMGLPARWARIGIVLDPAFMLGQILNDQFQGWFNTRYGFRPVFDTFQGWWNIVHNTEAFKEALRAGGVEKSALRGKTTLADILAGPNLGPGEAAFQQLRTLHPFKALQSIITPMREATRMGEYLRARGAGATPIEAAWAARDLLGNYSLQGTFTSMRALNHMSMFLGPAIAVTDKTFRTIKERPGQWFTRASTLAGIATLLYMANQDDEEIQQLRQTPGGQRWFFVRMPSYAGGDIIKIRKPYFEGAVFASGMEAVLDEWKGNNPDAFKLWSTSVKQELALNMLPVMGVVPFNLWANKDLNSGSPIVPDAQTGLDPQFQTGYYSGSAERLVGKEVGISPAILSYVVRSTTGYLGESAVKGVSAAMDWVNTGELPPKEDLPLTQRVFAKYPSYSVKPIQDFYKMAGEVDQAAKSINFATNHSPEDLETTLLGHEKELPLIELFNDSRQQISDLRNSIQMIEDVKDLGPQSKKEYTDEFLRTIIEIADATVQTARQIQTESQAQ